MDTRIYNNYISSRGDKSSTLTKYGTYKLAWNEHKPNHKKTYTTRRKYTRKSFVTSC